MSALAHAGPARRWSTPPRPIPVAAGEAGAGGVVAVPMRVLTPAGMFAPVFAGLAAIAGRVAPCPEVLRRAGWSGVSYRRSAREQLADRGGQLEVFRDTIEVICKPLNVPEKIVIDVTDLDIGVNLHIGDVKLPEGVRAVYDESYSVVGVVAVEAEEVKAEATK